ncbi:MAG: hypothetical protein ACTHLJ_02630 [Angustibacter sp.]
MRVRALLGLAAAVTLAAASALTTASGAQASTSRVSLATGSKTTTAGFRLRVAGKIVAPSPRRKVRMQYYAGGRWHTWATATSTSRGSFSLVYRAAPGHHTARVYVSGSKGYRGIASPHWKVRGYKPGTYVAPTSFSYAGSRCVKSGSAKWTIHYLWRAKGGYYVQLGHLLEDGQQMSQKPVSVYGTDRTWESVAVNVYGSRPDSETPRRDQIVSALGRSSDITAWRNFEAEFAQEVAVSCPA